MNETEDTCRHCAHYRPNYRYHSGNKRNGAAGRGRCTCWIVKGRNGDYLCVSSRQEACPHYMPKGMTINSME